MAWSSPCLFSGKALHVLYSHMLVATDKLKSKSHLNCQEYMMQGIPDTPLKKRQNIEILIAVWYAVKWKKTCKWILCDSYSDTGRWEVIMRNIELCLFFLWGGLVMCCCLHFLELRVNVISRQEKMLKSWGFLLATHTQWMTGTVTGVLHLCCGKDTLKKKYWNNNPHYKQEITMGKNMNKYE